MERVPLTAAAPLSRRGGGWRVRFLLAAALPGLAAGCSGDTFGKKKDADWKLPAGLPTTPMSSTLTTGSNDVVQAGATTPPAGAGTPASSFSIPGFGKGTKVEKKVPPTEMTVMWRNKVDYLPNPAANGQMGPGLVGQLFLFGPNMQFATPEGKLVVALYDESPRPPGAPPQKPVGWEFTKDVLKGLKTPDERFGMSYALFLPWPEYRPDVTRVRIAIRFDREEGHPLFIPETKITLDTGKVVDGGSGWMNQPFSPAAGGAQPSPQPAAASGPLGGPPPSAVPPAVGGPGMGVVVTGGGFVPSAAPPPAAGPAMPSPALAPGPANFGALAPAPGPSPARPVSPADLANLPPIAFTAPRAPGR